MRSRVSIKKIIFAIIAIVLVYGACRLYFALTGGFTIANITSDLPYDSRWETAPLSPSEKEKIGQALNQEYTYLGKGCQAYVFGSQDGQYVLKFFKFQRFRPQIWFEPFTFIPAVENYQHEKGVERKLKLDKVMMSWMIAYEYLSKDTGVLYVHLNKTNSWNMTLNIRDKLGMSYPVDVDKMEFLLQRQAIMLCPKIEALMKQGSVAQAKNLIDSLLVMLLLEYSRGFADNDHALMQNTGVLDDRPIHIDVGQLIYNESVRDPAVYQQELFDKTYKFHQWLEKNFPELATHLQARLVSIIGIDYFYKKPYVHKGNVAKIPHQN